MVRVCACVLHCLESAVVRVCVYCTVQRVPWCVCVCTALSRECRGARARACVCTALSRECRGACVRVFTALSRECRGACVCVPHCLENAVVRVCTALSREAL